MIPAEARALGFFTLGFATEGVTEVYQWLRIGSLAAIWPGFYYLSLATTILGFYFMALGARAWRATNPLPARRPRRIPWTLIVLFSGATISIVTWVLHHFRRRLERFQLGATLVVLGAVAALAVASWMEVAGRERRRDEPTLSPGAWRALAFVVFGSIAAFLLYPGDPASRGGGGAPIWVAAPVAGLIVLALGVFFYGLRDRVMPLQSRSGWAFGWVAFAWSLGVAELTGLLVGERILTLLTEFVSNWLALVNSFAPIAYAMAPLFVSYFLLLGAYWDGYRHGGSRARLTRPVDVATA
jgi:hypothetical protein